MINEIDSFIDFDRKEKISVEIPYKIGTILESKKFSNVLIKVVRYRIFVYKNHYMIYVGVGYNIESEYEIVDKEIELGELEKNWIKANTKTKVRKIYW